MIRQLRYAFALAAVLLGGCGGPAPKHPEIASAAGKADSTGNPEADACPGPYELRGKYSSLALSGTYVRRGMPATSFGDLVSATFVLGTPDNGLARGTYWAAKLGQLPEPGSYEEIFTIAVPGLDLIPFGLTRADGDGYLVTKASTDEDGTVSRLCVLQVMGSGAPQKGPAFELVQIQP
jgi:hypothetical protein